MFNELVTERLKLIDLYPDKAKTIAEEYGLKEGDVELIRKGKISEEPVIDREARTVKNYISTDAKDRDNEVIQHRGVVLDDYKKNPIVPWAHDYRGLPIGKNLWIKSDKKGLVAKTYFLTHDFAEDVFDLYTKDIHGTGPAMKAWSVGFVPLKWKDAKPSEEDRNSYDRGEMPAGVRRTYTKWLLLEYSAVPVPCNPEALTLMVEKGLIKNKKLIKDIEECITENKDKLPGAKEGKGLHEVLNEMDEVLEEDGTPRLKKREAVVITEDDLLEEIEEAEVREAYKAHGSVEDRTLEWRLKEENNLKPEENDKEIRIPAKGQEGKHKEHPIRWMTVSAEKGIKGLYCIKDKLIITYVFDKKKGWTMEKAQKWMKDNEKNVHIGETLNALTGELGLYIACGEEDPTVDLGIKAEKEPKELKLEKLTERIEILTEEVKELKEGKVFSSKVEETEEEDLQKEGRVLSGKNLKLVKDCREQIGKTAELLDKLIVASEPPKEESILPLITESKEKDNGNNIDGLSKKDIPIMIEEVLKGIKGSLEGQRQQIINQQEKIKETFSKTLGKV